ncbi:RRP12-like protein [Lates japonicus]|uniref:RRP12-like protein n=1 Tax=Lates japonicus TaxID=270547 RepID=A0AAD3R9V9_LATJO|nr:RRP12-like protein [Lates japonicus]
MRRFQSDPVFLSCLSDCSNLTFQKDPVMSGHFIEEAGCLSDSRPLFRLTTACSASQCTASPRSVKASAPFSEVVTSCLQDNACHHPMQSSQPSSASKKMWSRQEAAGDTTTLMLGLLKELMGTFWELPSCCEIMSDDTQPCVMIWSSQEAGWSLSYDHVKNTHLGFFALFPPLASTLKREEKRVKGHFSKNFLPILLFTVPASSPQLESLGTWRRMAAVLDTIKVYLTVTETQTKEPGMQKKAYRGAGGCVEERETRIACCG